MICPGKVVVIQICNENALIDDNFNIIINGITIGQVDLNQDDQVGSVFIGGPYNLVEPDFICPLNKMIFYEFDDSILNLGQNSLVMSNIQGNGNGNFGTVQIRLYDIIINDLVNPQVIADLEYSGGDGESFSFEFELSCGDTTSPPTTSPPTSPTPCDPCYPDIPTTGTPPPIPVLTTIPPLNITLTTSPPLIISGLNTVQITTTTTTTISPSIITPTPEPPIISESCIIKCDKLKF
jgi:hypothetical protein